MSILNQSEDSSMDAQIFLFIPKRNYIAVSMSSMGNGQWKKMKRSLQN